MSARLAWLDCSAGAAGDMLLAALIDAGADLVRVRDGLEGLGIDGWELEVSEVMRGGLRARRVEFGVPTAHPHRPWREIRALLQGATLPARARHRAVKTFSLLAGVEAHLHGVPVDEVELHEVGSIDAILDITGVALALEDLSVDELVATPLPMGTGRVEAAHGTLPLPAPATLALLRGWPVVGSPWPGEWVTPTGAALISALATPGEFPAMTPRHTGYGAGSRNPEGRANVVRVTVGEPPSGAADVVIELTANVDDMTGEQVPPLLARLLDEGALDAWATPTLMKKGRPGLILGALARPALADQLGEVLLRHSTSLGVRRARCTRQVLERWVDSVATPWGPVRVKVGGRSGRAWHAAPEYEDLARLARDHDLPVHLVHREALSAWTEGQDEPEG